MPDLQVASPSCAKCKDTRMIRTEREDTIIEQLCPDCNKLKVCKEKHEAITFYSKDCPVCSSRAIIKDIAIINIQLSQQMHILLSLTNKAI